MRNEAPDSTFYLEVADLNCEFLRLLTDAAGEAPAEDPLLGLGRDTLTAMAGLGPARLSAAVAGLPGLLADVTALFNAPSARIADAAPAARLNGHAPGGWRSEADAYALALATYVWQAARRSELLLASCIGLPEDQWRSLRCIGFGEMRQRVAAGAHELRARFASHPCFWRDLVDTATAPDAASRQLMRLRFVQLCLARPSPATRTRNRRR